MADEKASPSAKRTLGVPGDKENGHLHLRSSHSASSASSSGSTTPTLSSSKSEASSSPFKRRVISGIFKDNQINQELKNQANKDSRGDAGRSNIPSPPPPPPVETKEDKRPPKKPRAKCADLEVRLHTSDKIVDPLRDLLDIPTDDIEVETIPRTFRTEKPTVPQELLERKDAPLHVRDCLDYFLRNWMVSRPKYRNYGGSTVPDLSKYPKADDFKEMFFNSNEGALIFPAPIETFKLDARLLADYSMDIKKLDDKDRQVDRHPLFALLPPSKDALAPSDTRITPPPPTISLGTPVHMVCKELSFSFGDVEPLFCHVSLLDMKKKRRVSETYSFSLNTPKIWWMLDKRPTPDPSTTSRQALFHVTDPNPDTYMVLRIEKVLQGDFDPSTEPYFKHQTIKQKEKDKYLSEIEAACKRLGKYMQPFAVGMLPLFDEGGKPLFGATGDQQVNVALVRASGGDQTDQHIFSLLPRFINEKERQKLRVYPCTCTFAINSTSAEHLVGRLTPSLQPVLPVPVPEKDTHLPTIREIQEFHDADTNQPPQAEFVNNLYIQPQYLNFTGYTGSASARNLTLEIKLVTTDDPKAEGLAVFYGRISEPRFVTSVWTTVLYHNKRPSLYDEFKVALPFIPTPQHHLLFIVHHIQCVAKKRREDSVTTPIAFGWLPLLNNGKLLEDQEHQIMAYHPVISGYFSPEVSDGLKVADKGKKPAIFVRTRLVSSIHSLDYSIQTFFNYYDNRNSEDVIYQNAYDAIVELKNAKPQAAALFLPVLLRELLDIICNESIGSARAAFLSLATLVKNITSVNTSKAVRCEMLEQFVHYSFENSFDPKNLLPERLIMNFNSLIAEKASEGYFIEDLCRYSWFYFELVIKTVTLSWKQRNILGESLPRLNLMSETFGTEMELLIDNLVKEMHKRLDHETGREDQRALEVTGQWNVNLALFFKDLLGVIDRGAVLTWVNRYLDNLVSTSVPNQPLAIIQASFLRILTDYEHYIPLNIPGMPSSEDKVDLLSYWEKHFLSGLLINEINGVFFRFTHKDHTRVRLCAVNVLYHLLLKHDLDERYQTPERKERIASLYFPFILVVIEAQIVHNILFTSDVEERMAILLCFLYIVRYCPRRQLRDWWKKETQKRVTYFFVVLAKALDCFEFGNISLTPDTGKSLVVHQLVYQPDDLMGVRNQDKRNVINNMEGTLSKRKEKTKANLSSASTNRLMQQLSREVGLISLDMLMDFMQDFSAELNSKTSHFIENVVVNILLLMLKKNQCEAMVSAIFAALRHVIFCFPKQLFKYANNFCSDISFEVFRYCNSPSGSNRTKAAATLYLLLKHNFLTMRNFTRMKLQSTSAVSKLVGAGLTKDPAGLREALDAVQLYSMSDKQPQVFTNQVKELISRLHNALASSAALYDNAYDPEMTADLYYTISLGYNDSPDLRIVWFTNLASFHTAEKNFEESAVCKLHLAALVLSYINLLKPSEAINLEPLLFARAAPNIACDLIVPSELEEGICQSAAFSRQGVLNVLLEAVSSLKEHELYESCVDVLRLIITIYKKNRNYSELSKVFQDLQVISEKVVNSNLGNSRLFSSYYRVAFFGQLFGKLDGKQYIYKEQLGVRLADISERLTKQYKDKFGNDSIIQLGNNIDMSQLDLEKKGYIQIVYVEPYFGTLEEQQKRSSPWDRRFNLDRFVFETPFTQSGKAHGETAEQFKRKTILTTEKPFPFVVKRLLVTHKEEVVLSPIENATEVIVNRNRASKLELSAIPPNSKTLQIVLQGSVLPQVNAGPLEFARVFLGHADNYPAEQVKALETALSEFVVYSHALLQLNKQVIKADQIEFQQTMEESYEKLLMDLSEFFPIPDPNAGDWQRLIPIQLRSTL